MDTIILNLLRKGYSNTDSQPLRLPYIPPLLAKTPVTLFTLLQFQYLQLLSTRKHKPDCINFPTLFESVATAFL